MFVSKLNFSEVLERFYNNQIIDGFYHQDRYDFLLLFVSSFDGNDINIISKVVENAKRIDRITGHRICFFYFIDRDYYENELKDIEWIAKMGHTSNLFNMGAHTTMETADDICQHFGVLRSQLPAFILINQKREQELFPIQDYQDFERFLSPLNIIHSYNEDKRNIILKYESIKDNIISDYKKRRKETVVTQQDVDSRKMERIFWENEIKRINGRIEIERSRGELERVKKREEEILALENKLELFPELVLCGEDESIPYPEEQLNKVHYPQEELDDVKAKAAERLNFSLNIHDGIDLIEKSQDKNDYIDVILKIWNLVRMRKVNISRILERIRYEIHEHGFDVFISCKSQDYTLAHELYDYLVYNGFRPFLADTSIKEVGIDQYTALIGEVINVCQNMIVFATDLDYIETPYVAAEWHTFVNDINTGHKPNAKLVNILAPNIDVHHLPAWLRDKQCFTIENYKDGLIHFLRNRDNNIAERVMDEVNKAYSRIRDNADQLLRHQRGGEVEYLVYRFKDNVEKDYHRIVSRLDRFRMYGNEPYDINRLELDELSARAKHVYKEWEVNLCHLAKEVEQIIENEESAWCKAIHYSSVESLKSYLEQYPNGIHSHEATERFHYVQKKCERNRMSNQDENESLNSSVSYLPMDFSKQATTCYTYASLWDRLLGRKTFNVYSSIFAPAEIKFRSHMQVQVYLHLYEETEKVKALAQESDKNAERRDYIPLQCKLKKGDKVDVQLNIYGETLLMSDKKRVVWQGSFTKCSFDYFVTKDIDVDELSCVAMLTVNGVPVGEMRFITRIVDAPRQLNPEIIAHKYNKVFISYSHQDESKVKFLHEGLELGSVPHFFDRKYLKAGDVFPQVIQDYINSADLFILCWSENASKSEYVQKERLQALERAFPQVKPEQEAKLRIYPMSIEPRAELPSDMKENYHFGEI